MYKDTISSFNRNLIGNSSIKIKKNEFQFNWNMIISVQR